MFQDKCKVTPIGLPTKRGDYHAPTVPPYRRGEQPRTVEHSWNLLLGNEGDEPRKRENGNDHSEAATQKLPKPLTDLILSRLAESGTRTFSQLESECGSNVSRKSVRDCLSKLTRKGRVMNSGPSIVKGVFTLPAAPAASSTMVESQSLAQRNLEPAEEPALSKARKPDAKKEARGQAVLKNLPPEVTAFVATSGGISEEIGLQILSELRETRKLLSKVMEDQRKTFGLLQQAVQHIRDREN